MISQRRLSRGVERPADGEAVEAAYVIGKALTHSGKGLGQNNKFREPVPRSGSMVKTRVINNGKQETRPSSMVASRHSSLGVSSVSGPRHAVRTKSVRSERNEPRRHNTVKTYSLTTPRNNMTRQEEVQTVFDEFGGPQRRGVIYRSPSMTSKPKITRTRTVRKYVPSEKGLIAIDVPAEEAQQQRQDQGQRHQSMTRSSSRNFSSLKSQARANSLTSSRSNSLTASRSVSLSSLRANSTGGRSSSRCSSLTGSKPNFQPPRRYSSITGSSSANEPKRSQAMSIPLEEEEENVKPLTSEGQMEPVTALGDDSFSAATTTQTTTTTITTITTKPLGASEPSGRAKTIKIVKKQSPTTTTTTAADSPTSTEVSSRPPQRKLLSYPSSYSSSLSPLPSPSKSQPTFETLDPTKGHQKLELYETLIEGQDVILEDEREDRDDEAWDNELEKEIKRSLEKDSRQVSRSPEPVFPVSPMENSESSTLQNPPVEDIINPSISEDLKQREEREFVLQKKDYVDNTINGLRLDYKPVESEEDSSNQLEFTDHLEGTPLATAIFFADKIEEIPELPVSEISSNPPKNPSHNSVREHFGGSDGQSDDNRGNPPKNPSHNGVREPFGGSDRQSDDNRGNGKSVISNHGPSESIVRILGSSTVDLQTPDRSGSVQEKDLDEEVRHELEIMGHDSSNSDENSDELFVDSREDILDDVYVGNGPIIPSLPQRNPKRGYGYGGKLQVDEGASRVVSPIKSALKKSTSEYFDPAIYTEASPASQAYLSLTTAENTRLNAQLGSDMTPRRNVRSVSRSTTLLNRKNSPLSSSSVRDAATSKRHSNHVGIRAPGKKISEAHSTRYSMPNNKPLKTQQYLKNDPTNPAKSSNALLYPREPPKRRSSFEKSRNKNETIGMSKLSLRDGPSLDSSYQQNHLDNRFDGNVPSAPASSNESGASSALFSGGFKSRFQDSDSEDENLPSNGASGGKAAKQANGTTSTGNGFSLFKHKDGGESEGFGKKFGKFSLKLPDSAYQEGDYSRDEAFIDEELAESARKFGKKLKKLFGRSK